jgi:excisionase family DNA binding protein
MSQQVKSDRSFLSTGEACERTGLSSRYIQRLLQQKRLDGFKASSIWFVYEDSLSAFVATPRKRGPKGMHSQTKRNQPTSTPIAEQTNGTHTGEDTRGAEGQEA